MAVPQREHALRDHLAVRLDLVEPGLTLISTEYPLDNQDGAGGFIDILARDRAGDLVVIELKRSDQTSRQALHELEKYVALLAADRGVRIDQMRCILLSTSWHELAVPFARFLHHVDFHVDGRVLEVDSDGLPAGSGPVTLPSVESGLELCPIHLDLLFPKREDRAKTLLVVNRVLEELCVEDYVIVTMDYAGESDAVLFPFSLYVAFAEFAGALRDFLRIELPSEDADEPADARWWFEQRVQGAIVDAIEVDRTVEIGSPDRFKAASTWVHSATAGYGRYADELVWTPERLVEMVASGEGRFSTSFTRTSRPVQKAAWKRMRSDLNRCLVGAGQWAAIVSAWLDEREAEPRAEVYVHAYVPNDVLYGLDSLARSGTPGHMPQLLLRSRAGTTETLVGGTLRWDNTTRVQSVSQTLAIVFDDFMHYMVVRASGGLSEVEERLSQLHGLTYQVIESMGPIGNADIGTPQRLSVKSDGSLTRIPLHPGELAENGRAFVEAHQGYLSELRATFDQHVMRIE